MHRIVDINIALVRADFPVVCFGLRVSDQAIVDKFMMFFTKGN